MEAVRQLPRSEKLKLMEVLWESLSQPNDQFMSPAWHTKELADTEQHFAEGQEEILDWEKAKKSNISFTK